MPKLLGVYIKTSWILFLSITIGQGKESILQRWLVPENGQPEKRLPDEQLRGQIRVIVEIGNTLDRLQHIAVSRTAGIWRIKRSKIILAQTNQILRRMEMDNLITLPIPQKNTHKSTLPLANPSSFVKYSKRLILRPSDINRLQFIPVLNKEDSHLWRYLINNYHYIKESLIFGAQMRYLVFGGRDVQRTGHLFRNRRTQSRYKQRKLGIRKIQRGKHLLAALGFAAGSWRLGSRDRYIGWTDEQREANLKLVVNNARFLIMPWIYSPNLASRILGGIAKQLPLDWEARYNYQPVLLETFVQLDRFKGTCYQAANWIEVGKTEGYSLFSSYKRYASAKAIYVYPLRKNFRRQLCHL